MKQRTRRAAIALALLLMGALYASCSSSPGGDAPTPSSDWDSMVWDESHWK
jgi:hypothetical protein